MREEERFEEESPQDPSRTPQILPQINKALSKQFLIVGGGGWVTTLLIRGWDYWIFLHATCS